MNQSDSERIASLLESMNYKPASEENEADLIVVNMCSIRQSAVDRIDGLMRKLTNKKSNKKFILTGCILQQDVKKLKRYFNFILPIKTLKAWPKILKEKEFVYYPNQRDDDFNKKFKFEYFKIIPESQNKYSALIPISSGCNNFCTYCVVPYTRGSLMCRNHQEIIKEVKKLVKNGVKEVWLLGQNVNDYKSGKIDFPELLKLINKIEGNFWIRFTSPHPKNFSDKLIKAMVSCEKYKHYLNLPLQSGDDQILKRMNRPYTTNQYKKLVQKIKKSIPDISLSTDIIIGFANETKKQFENTLKMIKEIEYDMAYFAVYSPRSQTAGIKFTDNITKKEKQKRYKKLDELIRKTALKNNKKYIGRTVEVLVNESKKNILIGKSDTYKTVIFNGPKSLIGKFVEIKIDKADPFILKGEILISK
jgi:tRNA-2-methylthio-N6-dimethylallyladenosine synthase